MRAVFLLFLLCILVVPTASAAVTLTQDTIVDTQVFTRHQFEGAHTINVTLSGTDPLYDYHLWGFIGDNVTSSWLPAIPAPTIGFVGEMLQRNVTGDGTYSFVLDPDEYPFTATYYYMRWYAQAYYPSNGTSVGAPVMTDSVAWTIGGPVQGGYYWKIAVKDQTPASMSSGPVAVKDGVSLDLCFFHMTKNVNWESMGLEQWDGHGFEDTTWSLWAFVTDDTTNRNIVAYALLNSSLIPLCDAAKNEITIGAEDYVYGINYAEWNWGGGFFQYNATYHIYYGLRCRHGSGTIPYFAEIKWDILDSSMVPAEFYVNDVFTEYSEPDTGTRVISGYTYGTSNTYFIGVTATITTSRTTHISATLDAGSLGDWVRDYGDSIGMPWFFLLIAFLIIGITTCLPLALSLRYEIDLPNIAYAGFITIGVLISTGVGLLELWMCLFYFVVIALVIVLRYAEPLREFVSLTPEYTPGVGERRSERALGITERSLGIRERMRRLKDQGVTKRPVAPEPVDWLPGWKPPILTPPTEKDLLKQQIRNRVATEVKQGWRPMTWEEKDYIEKKRAENRQKQEQSKKNKGVK